MINTAKSFDKKYDLPTNQVPLQNNSTCPKFVKNPQRLPQSQNMQNIDIKNFKRLYNAKSIKKTELISNCEQSQKIKSLKNISNVLLSEISQKM